VVLENVRRVSTVSTPAFVVKGEINVGKEEGLYEIRLVAMEIRRK
jgi:hypothetical protein